MGMAAVTHRDNRHPERAGVYPKETQPGANKSAALPEKSQNNNRELFRVRASRLADIFPDELVVQEKTISVIRREFLVSFVETLPIKDIGRVVYTNTPLFGGITILGKNPAHELKIRGLPKKAAIQAKEIVEGLLLEDQGVIDVPDWLHTDTRRDMLEKAGKNPKP